ncbi:patatin-like phospholipase family protein [Pseudoduganella namucuonensis]|uniref:Predicted acylesterase/phospholipase RssA, contains patatin domain n=1 Tax=Pseudoduganella namucuonensis TaxID=1035707 RepID=A0A1I7J6G8_9BURK|nr:patatin-like phospholipase family protein [Pseudoduganella namucuonensis]SFU80747.1 Predicted acylesterase/phospholipase RssA, contains patatin domain [Pseudoduganella namucuonensis]
MPKNMQDSKADNRSAGKIGLALAGGGPLAVVYEIGALAAIAEAIDGLDLNEADIYVGVSAGAIITSALANGITPHQMCRLFVESDVDAVKGAMLFKPETLLRPALREFAKRARSVPRLFTASVLHYARDRKSLAASFERMTEALPAGFLSADAIGDFLKAAYDKEGYSNDFRKLARKLVIVATDLDTGKAVRFGEEGWDGTPISVAVQASSAVPGLFPPVEINGHHFVDGALRKTMHASIALEDGVDVLLLVNPIVPYNARFKRGAGKLVNGGLIDVLSQTVRSILHSRLETGLASYQVSHPHVDILLFQPSETDAELFFTNMFSYNNRRRTCEQAYQNTRLALWQQRHTLAPKLARHGMRLNLPVLRDTSMTLVDAQPQRKSLARLDAALVDLERYLKVAHGV